MCYYYHYYYSYYYFVHPPAFPGRGSHLSRLLILGYESRTPTESPTLRRTTAAGVQVSPGPALQNLHRGREKLLEITVWRWQGPPLPHPSPPGVHLLCEQCLLPRGLLKARATSVPSLSGSRFKKTSADHLSFPSKQTGFMLEVSSKQSFPTQILSSWGQKCNKTEPLGF